MVMCKLGTYKVSVLIQLAFLHLDGSLVTQHYFNIIDNPQYVLNGSLVYKLSKIFTACWLHLITNQQLGRRLHKLQFN